MKAFYFIVLLALLLGYLGILKVYLDDNYKKDHRVEKVAVYIGEYYLDKYEMTELWLLGVEARLEIEKRNYINLRSRIEALEARFSYQAPLIINGIEEEK